MTEFYIMKE